MCSGSKRKPDSIGFVMEGEARTREDGLCQRFSILLELAASDDLIGFRNAVEEEGLDVDEVSIWYGGRIGSKKMGFELRTPLMIAAMFGSKNVLLYIIGTGCADLNQASGSDGATALHLAVAGDAPHAPEIVGILLDALADANKVDASGNRPGDLIAPVLSSTINSRRKMMEVMLKGSGEVGESCKFSEERVVEKMELPQQESLTPQGTKDGTEKKEYPIDLSLPDIKNGIYGTDEFRMYTFKIKPCSRAYSHDWTECPFVHPGENARRRDPRKYHYSCVPCPEFRKGSCGQGDSCEYAHGIFECWLHPAQYRTRLCKDETGCTRRVCFFAHKPEELRPLYASTGSAVPSPKSFSTGAISLEMGSVSPLSLGSSSVLLPVTLTPPMTPSGDSSPMNGNIWQNQPNVAPPTLQLPDSRLKSTFSARNIDLDMELLGLENHRRRLQQQQQQLMEEYSGLSSSSSWNNPLSAGSPFAASVDQSGEFNRFDGVKPSNLKDIFGSLDHASLPQLQGLSMDAGGPQILSPNENYLRQNMNQQLRASYPTNLSSSPARASPSFGSEHSAAAVLSYRRTAFAKRSQSFIDRSVVTRHSGTVMPSTISDWSSPDGKLDWGMQGDELNKLRKSASFGFRSNGTSYATDAASNPAAVGEPDVSWVQTLVKDAPSGKPGELGYDMDEQQQNKYNINTGGSEVLPAWMKPFYMEQEPMVA